ncbi:MAG: hypothetical protein ACLFN8_01485 [Candidatus Woesearchaeota archaeon]
MGELFMSLDRQKSIYTHLAQSGTFNLERLCDDYKQILGSNVINTTNKDILSSSDILFSGSIKNRTCGETIKNFVQTLRPESENFRNGARLIYNDELVGFAKFNEKINVLASCSVTTSSRNFFKFPLIKQGIYSVDESLFDYIRSFVDKREDGKWVDIDLNKHNKQMFFDLNLIVHPVAFVSIDDYYSFRNNILEEIKNYSS